MQHGQELLLELCDRDTHGVDGDRERGDDFAGVVADRDAERAQPGLEQAVGDDVAVGADLAGRPCRRRRAGRRAGSARATSASAGSRWPTCTATARKRDCGELAAASVITSSPSSTPIAMCSPSCSLTASSVGWARAARLSRPRYPAPSRSTRGVTSKRPLTLRTYPSRRSVCSMRYVVGRASPAASAMSAAVRAGCCSSKVSRIENARSTDCTVAPIESRQRITQPVSAFGSWTADTRVATTRTACRRTAR